ncbi:MAG TPA: hypothetical protein VGM54_11525 [Chthoniobacter sp.]|jgi:hypothetical protein
MNVKLLTALPLLCTAALAFSEPSGDEISTRISRVQTRVTGGDISALNDLTALPAKNSCPAFLAIYKKNRTDTAVTSKCAQLLVAVPGGEEFIQKLLDRKAVDNPEFSQQEIAINCLVLNHDKTSVRILASTLDYFNPKEMGPIILRALATLNPPGSPTMPKGHADGAEALAQWKEWWSANKGNFSTEATPK